MKHLGERITSFVDGQLDDNARDQVLAHLSRCRACRDSAGEERSIKAALHELDDVEPSAELIATLHAIADPGGPFPPQRRPFPATAAAVAGWRTANDAGRPFTSGGDRPVARRSARVAVAGALSVGALTVLLAGLGGADAGDGPSEVVEPEFDRFSMEHARSAGYLPFGDPAAILVSTVSGGFGTSGGVGPMGTDR